MNLAFLTNGLFHGATLLQAIRTAGLSPLCLMIVERPPVESILHRIWRHIRRADARSSLDAVAKRLGGAVVVPRHPVQTIDYSLFASRVEFVDDANGALCESMLRDAETDILVLGGARILGRHILSVPHIGTLNAHPGLLPAFRGSDVIAWAIHEGATVGVTVHYVNEGIDTGDILRTREIPVLSGESLDDVKRRAAIQAGDLMAEVLSELCRGLTVEAVPQSKEKRRPLFRQMTSAQILETQRRLAARTGRES